MSFNLVTVGGTPTTGAGAALFGSQGFIGGGGVYGMPDARQYNQPDQFLFGDGSYGVGGTKMGTGTVEFWMKRNGVPSTLEVMVGHDTWWWIGIPASSSTMTLHYGGGGVSELVLNLTGVVTDNAWHHVAVVFNDGQPAVWLDGVSAGSSTSTQAVAPSDTTGFMIGGWLSNGLKFSGSLDEISLSNIARYTGAFTRPATAFADRRANQVAVYHFDSGTLDTATPIILPNDSNIIYSPYTWSPATSTSTKTINAGAYFRFLVQGSPTTIQLLFDVTMDVYPQPELSYRIDGGDWTPVGLQSMVTLAMPTNNVWDKHTVEVVVKSMTETASRWSPQSTACVFTGVYTLPETCTTKAITKKAINVLCYGDSITEGVRTLGASQPNDTDRNDSSVGWAYRLTETLGAEVGVVGFGGSGLTVTGSGSVPVLSTTYNLLWSGQSRSFSPSPDIIVINEGTNDGATDITTQYTAILNLLLAAVPSTTKIACMLPFNGGHSTQIPAAIAACNSPGQCHFIDTTGWFSTSDSSDGTHPYGYVGSLDLSPRLAAAIRSFLANGSVYINSGGTAKLISPTHF